MLWGYLSQFWQEISDVVIGGITYTAQFFQNIGNAVAGAIGQFFDVLFHNLNDVLIFFGWFFSNIKTIFLFLLSPVSYFFTFLKTFISALGQAPSTPAVSYAFSTDTLAVFDAIPHFDTFKLVLGAVIIFLGGVAILKLLLNT
jgi:hypothetical protein